MTLDNGITRLEFDPGTGSLVQVRDLRRGVDHLSAPADGRLFRVFAPDKDEWVDRFADSHLSGRPAMDLRGDTLTIRWRDLVTGEGKPAGVGAVVTVRLPQGADEALFTLSLENHSPHQVCEVLFPWIGGWRGYPGEKGIIQVGDHWPIDPWKVLRRNDGWNLMNMTRKINVGFPHVHIPLCDVSNGTVGLSCNFYPVARDLNYDVCVLDLNERLGDPHPSWAWVHRPFTPQGGAWESGRVGLAPHDGDWHDAAIRLRRWLAGWWKPPAPRAGLHRALGFHNVLFRDFTGRNLRPLSDMPGIARHGKTLGLDHFLVWDMPLLGMYLRPGGGGIFDDAPARVEELRTALRAVREAGVHVSPLINLRLGTQSSPFWREKGDSWAIRSQYGQPAPETLPLRQHTSQLINRPLDQGGAKFCQADPRFQEWALGCTTRALDLGFDALFIDQPFSEDYCFAAGHGHRPGAPGHEGTCSWIPRAAELVHARGPDSYVMGEVPDIWNTQYFDVWWHWDWSWLRPEIFRFVLPDSLQSWVIDAYDHEDQLAKAFARGFLLNLNVRSLEKTLADVPDFSSRVAALAMLKDKTFDASFAGRFLDRTGLTMEAPDTVTAAVYDTGATVAVALGEGSPIATGSAAGGTRVKLLLDQGILGDRTVTEIVIHGQDGTSRTVQAKKKWGAVTVETRLSRHESAVIVLALPPA